MAENKTYTIGGRRFKLREKFTVLDLEKRRRVESLLFKTRLSVERKEENELYEMFGEEITGEELVQYVADVLIPLDGNSVPTGFFNDMEDLLSIEIFMDFFFVYLKLSKNSERFLAKLEKRANESIAKLKPSKTN